MTFENPSFISAEAQARARRAAMTPLSIAFLSGTAAVDAHALAIRSPRLSPAAAALPGGAA